MLGLGLRKGGTGSEEAGGEPEAPMRAGR